MGQKEPPSSLQHLLFIIGRNSKGQWVVQDQGGLHGGLFVNRTEALKYALFENGNRPQAVVMVPDVIELNITGKVPGSQPALSSSQLQLRAA